ncbi:septal ring lytic transglycosylase RlpA family protein [Terriglobus roseus]|uniref:Probable endolytic peptidoglycan transglycosylase RlpA n=1 Tax=Terriglobus roseus TaxID=392734 RepID=A0A1H4NB64_9BACT|nr:septal ring lytic transglycosylase RlpA family protein [Terriglobus roseus]SEB92334.1 rare lipoprotein A [Terriglobus roseus]
MNVHYTDNGSELLTASSARVGRAFFAARNAGSNTLSRTLLHARALVRVARRRPQLAFGLLVAAGSALATAGAATSSITHRMEMSSTALAPEQLAPHSAPPAPPAVAAQPHHHHFLGLHTNPLRGLASWYGAVWNGRKTASGETFDETKLTAAHKTLPLGTLVRVTNLESMRSVIVKINDRGTLAPNRVIDLSSAAAHELGMVEKGLANVKLEVLGHA